jgi:hypothetical protein
MKRFIYTDWFGDVTEVTSNELTSKLANWKDLYKWVDTCKVGDKWDWNGNQETPLLKLECTDEIADAELLMYQEDEKICVGLRSVYELLGDDVIRDGDYYVKYFELPIYIDKCILKVGRYTIRLRSSVSIGELSYNFIGDLMLSTEGSPVVGSVKIKLNEEVSNGN